MVVPAQFSHEGAGSLHHSAGLLELLTEGHSGSRGNELEPRKPGPPQSTRHLGLLSELHLNLQASP